MTGQCHDEENLRALQAALEGVDPEPAVTFLGARYAVAPSGGLAALLRYAAVGQPSAAERAELTAAGNSFEGEPAPQAAMAASHRLLEECLEDFPAFARAALDGKASADDVQAATRRITELLAARPAMAAMRLLHYVAANFAELDGTLLMAGGPGLTALSAREACNVAYAQLLGQTDPERRAEWIEGLYLEYNPEQRALEMVRHMQADRERAARAAAEQEADDGGPDLE